MFSVSLIYNAYMVVYYYTLRLCSTTQYQPNVVSIFGFPYSISEYCNILRLRMGTPFCFYCYEQIVQYISVKNASCCCYYQTRLLVPTLEVSTFSFDLAAVAIIHFSLRNKKQGPSFSFGKKYDPIISKMGTEMSRFLSF